ncbi:MAG: sigma-70 family RNA polymerase sigma factor [Planctomycetaceae bacterium]|nr:sigma-70 family RNA polymerase sigma factor [Planctomycetaceae bacterium]
MNRPLDAARDADQSDEHLMCRAQEGETPALGEIDRRYRRRLEGQAIQWLPPFLPARREVAEDLAGNTIFKVLKAVKRTGARWDSTKGSVWVWLEGILRNEMMSFLRVKKGKEILGADRTLTDDEGREVSFEDLVIDPSGTAEQRTIEQEQQQRLQQELGRLSGELETIVRLKYERECSHAEIADAFKTSVPTISRRLAEGRAELQKALDSDRSESTQKPRTMSA